MNTALFVAAVAGPPLVAFTVPHAGRAFVYGTAWVWALMIGASHHHLATDPEYNSFAPGLSLLCGWFSGGVYTAPWVIVAAAARRVRREDETQSP